MKKGDRVSVLDENLSGTVTKIDSKTVIFEDEHGFLHQYPIEKLIIRSEEWTGNITTDSGKSGKKKSSGSVRKSTFTLDLHFDRLTPDHKKYNSADRLALQKEKILETIDQCMRSGVRKIEIIHGIGDGTLQNMVRETLEAKGLEFYDNALYLDQSGSVTVFL